MAISRRKTRKVSVGSTFIGGNAPISTQSMCATKTTDVKTTLWQINLLKDAGANFIRIAVDSKAEVEA